MPELVPTLFALAQASLAMGRVTRVTRHPDGVQLETDAEHTLMLVMVACTLASQRPGINVGRVAELASVHDLVEIHAGDTPSLRLTPEEWAAKVERESAALERLRSELQGSRWVLEALDEYEAQRTPEARLVRLVDKLLPKLTHSLNGGAALRALGLSEEDFHVAVAAQRRRLGAEYGDLPEILSVLDELIRLEMGG